jgi:hypothetical protein
MQATAAPSRWLASQAGEILPALESGSPAQIEHAVAALHADPILQAELTSDRSAAATDHDRDDPAAKASKQGKQGKHRGKHRGKGHRRYGRPSRRGGPHAVPAAGTTGGGAALGRQVALSAFETAPPWISASA